MSTETVLAVFTGIVAAALLTQSIAFWRISISVRNISKGFDRLSEDLLRRVETVSSGVNDLLASLKPVVETIQTIQQRIAASSEIIHDRVVELDHFAQEFTDTARSQLLRIQDAVESSSKKFEETVETLQRGILAPVSEISAIMRGLKIGLDFFFRGRRPPSHQPHQDEEMFI